MICFQKIRWRNFLSTGNQWTEIQLDEKSTTIVIGSNGAGKSTVLDALTFSLFNKPFRKINKPQLLNSTNEKDCLVEIEVKVDNEANSVALVCNKGCGWATLSFSCDPNAAECAATVDSGGIR